jgi:hypothetical protein
VASAAGVFIGRATTRKRCYQRLIKPLASPPPEKSLSGTDNNFQDQPKYDTRDLAAGAVGWSGEQYRPLMFGAVY